MTFRITKYTHNAWKAAQKFKNPQTLTIYRQSLPHQLIIIPTVFGCILTFRFLAKKLIEENIYIHESVKFLFLAYFYKFFDLILLHMQ